MPTSEWSLQKTFPLRRMFQGAWHLNKILNYDTFFSRDTREQTSSYSERSKVVYLCFSKLIKKRPLFFVKQEKGLLLTCTWSEAQTPILAPDSPHPWYTLELAKFASLRRLVLEIRTFFRRRRSTRPLFFSIWLPLDQLILPYIACVFVVYWKPV